MPHLVFVGEGRQIHIALATRIQNYFLDMQYNIVLDELQIFLPFVLFSGVANSGEVHPDPVPALEPETTPTV